VSVIGNKGAGRNARHFSSTHALPLVLSLLLASCQAPGPKPAPRVLYTAQALQDLPPIAPAHWSAAWPAWLASCAHLAPVQAGDWRPRRAPWRPACERAAGIDGRDAEAIRAYFAAEFQLYRIQAPRRAEDSPGTSDTEPDPEHGLLTGYYEPLLQGSRVPDQRFAVPLYGVPADLVRVELAEVYPSLKGMRLRGRIDRAGDVARVVPYWSRDEIDRQGPLRGHELVWVDDAMAAFFLQVQGSGRVQLAQGGQVRFAYADSNGRPYRSIGRWLVEQGEIKVEDASLQSITQWARNHPDRVPELLAQNPSVVFFRETELGDPALGPPGALGAPLTPGYSVAVDPQFVPLGAPMAIDSVHPLSGQTLARPVVAQDTGGAIRGPLRLDLFWGFGEQAEQAAGHLRAQVAVWVWVPKGVDPASLVGP
jgi:membrane-bound lytic murein transglycosylase A